MTIICSLDMEEAELMWRVMDFSPGYKGEIETVRERGVKRYLRPKLTPYPYNIITRVVRHGIVRFTYLDGRRVHGADDILAVDEGITLWPTTADDIDLVLSTAIHQWEVHDDRLSSEDLVRECLSAGPTGSPASRQDGPTGSQTTRVVGDCVIECSSFMSRSFLPRLRVVDIGECMIDDYQEIMMLAASVSRMEADGTDTSERRVYRVEMIPSYDGEDPIRAGIAIQEGKEITRYCFSIPITASEHYSTRTKDRLPLTDALFRYLGKVPRWVSAPYIDALSQRLKL